jgi:hypothetical protein
MASRMPLGRQSLKCHANSYRMAQNPASRREHAQMCHRFVNPNRVFRGYAAPRDRAAGARPWSAARINDSQFGKLPRQSTVWIVE